MKPMWIGNVYVGSCWIGTPEQIEETQKAIENQWMLSTKTPIDEEISIYFDEENDDYEEEERED